MVNMEDLRHNLKRIDFPDGAIECLKQLENIVSANAHNLGSGPPGKSIIAGGRFGGAPFRDIQKFIDEFVFCVSTDRRGVVTTRLTHIQQLQLSYQICMHWAERSKLEPRIRFAIFESLFCYRETEPHLNDIRMNTLSQVASLSVQLEIFTLLSDLTLWLLRGFFGSSAKKPSECPISNRIIDDLTQDSLHEEFFIPLLPEEEAVDKADAKLASERLPTTYSGCPSFAILVLIVAFSEREVFALPRAPPLAQVATEWISGNSIGLLKELSLLNTYVSQTCGNSNALIKAFGQVMDRLVCLLIVNPISEALPHSTDVGKLQDGLVSVISQYPSVVDAKKMPCKMFIGRHAVECLNQVRLAKTKAKDPDRVRSVLDRMSQILRVSVNHAAFSGTLTDVHKAYKSLRVEHTDMNDIFSSLL